MMNKQRRNEVTTWTTVLIKVIITLLVLNVTIGAYAVVMIFLYQFTGWFVFAGGLMATTIALEIRAIWGRKEESYKHTRSHRKTNRRARA